MLGIVGKQSAGNPWSQFCLVGVRPFAAHVTRGVVRSCVWARNKFLASLGVSE